jgi:hypothetical protein
MSNLLPPLRLGLDILPSPEAERPGVLLRDPFHYTDTVLFLPPIWVMALRYLDGQHSALDVQELLTRRTGGLVFSDEVREFVGLLQEQGFLETEEFHKLREERQREFREGRKRLAAHAGTAYPSTPEEIHRTFDDYFRGVEPAEEPADGLVGVAAPHVSPEGGWGCYAATYRRLAANPALARRTFMVLGTSHWGMPEKFGLTTKPFVTPLGVLNVNTDLARQLVERGGNAVTQDDYCHVIEHSIEFQCVFLQHVLGPDLKIVPILCGPLEESGEGAVGEERKAGREQFLQALGELAESQGDELFWVLGIDLTHRGHRYGDREAAVAERGEMLEVEEQDRRRLAAVCAGDSGNFLEMMKGRRDELNWCGSSTLYTFLRAVQGVRGRLLRYEQWNIDPESVVSFASLEFHKSWSCASPVI